MGFTSAVRTVATGAATVMVAAGLAVVTPATANAAPATYTVDCQTVPFSSQSFYVVPGETVTLTLVGFNESFDNATSTTTPMNPAGETVVMAAGDALSFEDTTMACTGAFYAEIFEAAPETVPSGSLLFTQSISISTTPGEITVTDNSGGNGDHYFGGDPACAVSVYTHGIHVYQTLDITVLTAGTYTFRGMYSTPAGWYVGLNPFHPIGDPFLAVYSAFDPANPDTGILGCNDDANDVGASNDAEYQLDGTIIEGHQPYFTASFTPGNYTLVLLTYEDLSASDMAAGYSPYWVENFAPGPMSTTFELWGPAGGLALAAAPTTAAAPTLPPTGSDADLGVSGVVLLFAGVVLVALSRRRPVRRRSSVVG